MSRFLSQRFSKLKEYIPGEQPRGMSYVKLNTNESPYPPSPEVIAAMNMGEIEKLRLYPDPICRALKETIAANYGVNPQNVIIGNGSDEILSFIFMAFCDKTTGVCYPDISYGFYPVYAQVYGLDSREIPLNDDFTLSADDYLNAGRTIVIANPNAPTGLSLRLSEIERIVKANPHSVVAIDEAYVDFGGESAVQLIKKYDNLIVIQTFSKSRSLAGARLGYGIASAPLIADMEKLRNSINPYNINLLTQLAGEAAIISQSYYDKNCAKIVETRKYTEKKLDELGFNCLDSHANFLFASSHKLTGEQVYSGLKSRGVLVRYFPKTRIKDFVRISIGTKEQMDIMLNALKEMLFQ